MSTHIKCRGCGGTLQTTDQKKVGYALSLEHDYCQSCYKLLHYGEVHEHFHPEDLPKLSQDAVCLMVSSVLHLDTLFTYPVYRYEPNLKYVYVINQIDLLPESTNLDDMLKQMIIRAKLMSVPFFDIIMMSAKNPYDIDNLLSYLQQFREKNIYLIGVQNSGKTTIFKALTKDQNALAFSKAGLTQEAISHQLGKHQIWDMPGLYQQGYIHHFLPYKTYKKLIPSQRIKPRIYQMKKQQSLMIEGLISISVMGDDQSIVLYVSDLVKIHKTKEARVKDLLSHKEEHFDIITEQYEEKSFKIKDKKIQITFADIGFMHIDGPNTIKILYPKGMHLSLSEALFK
ncbi:MAG: GTPase [Acholeplasmataceae bacterium]